MKFFVLLPFGSGSPSILQAIRKVVLSSTIIFRMGSTKKNGSLNPFTGKSLTILRLKKYQLSKDGKIFSKWFEKFLKFQIYDSFQTLLKQFQLYSLKLLIMERIEGKRIKHRLHFYESIRKKFTEEWKWWYSPQQCNSLRREIKIYVARALRIPILKYHWYF